MLLSYPGIQVCNLVIKQPTWSLISSQLSRRFVDRQQRQRQEVHGSSPEIRARKNPLRDFSMVIVAAIWEQLLWHSGRVHVSLSTGRGFMIFKAPGLFYFLPSTVLV